MSYFECLVIAFLPIFILAGLDFLQSSLFGRVYCELNNYYVTNIYQGLFIAYILETIYKYGN